MLLVDFLQWWYARGWGQFATSLVDKLRGLADFFSIGLLLRTLFAPFRQISAQDVSEGGPAAYLANFFDKLLSRAIGAVTRIIILIAGVVAISVRAVLSLFLVLVWPLMPAVPVLCVVLCVLGVAG